MWELLLPALLIPSLLCVGWVVLRARQKRSRTRAVVRSQPMPTGERRASEANRKPDPPVSPASTPEEEENVASQQDPAAVARNNYNALQIIDSQAYFKSNDYLSLRIEVAQKDAEITLWGERIKTLLMSKPGSFARASDLDEQVRLARQIAQMKELQMWDFALSYQSALVLKLIEMARFIEYHQRKAP